MCVCARTYLFSCSTVVVRIRRNIIQGCLLFSSNLLCFSQCAPISLFPLLCLSLLACSCIAINSRATVPYFWVSAERSGGRKGGKGCREWQLMREKKGICLERRRRDTQGKGASVCRSDATPVMRWQSPSWAQQDCPWQMHVYILYPLTDVTRCSICVTQQCAYTLSLITMYLLCACKHNCSQTKFQMEFVCNHCIIKSCSRGVLPCLTKILP